MLTLKKAELSDLPIIRPYLLREPCRLSVYSPGVLFMWRDYFHLSYALEEETLLLKLAYDGTREGYLYPLGTNPGHFLAILEEEHRKSREPLIFSSLCERDRDRLLARYPGAAVTSLREEADYLYETEKLAAFPGRKYGGQRNHLNGFRRAYPDHTVNELQPSDVPALLAFLEEYSLRHPHRPLFEEEIGMVREVLENYDFYGMTGAVLRAGGEIAAFAVGEVLGDTLEVHIEKADTRFSGAYQAMVSGFCSRFDPAAVPYTNREDDMGDEGLRFSKLSYHPVALLDKYTLTVRF